MNIMVMQNKKRLLLAALVGLAVLVGVGVGIPKAGAGGPPGGMANMPVPVVVRTLKAQKVQVWSQFSGRLVAVDQVQIRPQVSGAIKEIRFHDGQDVKAGDVLVVIEPEPYQAALERAEAAQAAAETQAALARQELNRAQGLIKSGAITKQLVDQRANARRVAEANVRSAAAEVKQARINLEYAYVKTPIDGRAGRAELTVGNLVQAGGNAPVLTRIVSNASIYADFEVDEQTYLRAVRQNAAPEAGSLVPVELQLRGEGEKTYTGSIHSFDNAIDPSTGTIRARALFENSDHILIPGMYVTVRMGSLMPDNALTVPEKAIGTDQNRKFVFVAEGGKAAYRDVKLGATVKDERVVLAGLKEGEKVIIEGTQHVRPDAPVDPKEETQGTSPVTSPAAETSAPSAPTATPKAP